MTMVKEVEVQDLDVVEYDKAGNLKATYIESGRGSDAPRVDLVVCICLVFRTFANGFKLPPDTKPIWMKLLDIFLPDGYPQSVTDDYTPYQVYVRGLMPSRRQLLRHAGLSTSIRWLHGWNDLITRCMAGYVMSRPCGHDVDGPQDLESVMPQLLLQVPC